MVLVSGSGDDPPASCFVTNANGDLPTCTQGADGHWTRSYPGDGAGSGGSAFGVLVVLVLLLGAAFTVWKVTTARRTARDAGMSEGDATAMTLLADGGLAATYVASNVRGHIPATPSRTTGSRLTELKDLLDQGLVTQAEYDQRRQAIIDGV